MADDMTPVEPAVDPAVEPAKVFVVDPERVDTVAFALVRVTHPGFDETMLEGDDPDASHMQVMVEARKEALAFLAMHFAANAPIEKKVADKAAAEKKAADDAKKAADEKVAADEKAAADADAAVAADEKAAEVPVMPVVAPVEPVMAEDSGYETVGDTPMGSGFRE